MKTGERPTRVRYVVVAAATLMSVLLYLDRFCISIAEIYIQEDLGLTKLEIGWMLSAFFWTYALGQVPAGWLTDRFGSRIMLTAYVLFWSLFTGLTGAVGVFAALLALRLGFGFAQAGAYPTASSIVSKWMPLTRRGTASGIIAFGGRVGGFLALLASGYMIVWLTPSNIDPTLKSSDLLNGPLLCRRLSETADPDPEVTRLRQTCWQHFSPEARAIIAEKGDEYAQAVAGAGESEPPEIGPLDESESSLLVEQLNRVIRTPDFFQPGDLDGVQVEQEAVRLMQAPDRTDLQSQRMNRLVVEGLFRESIKKLYVAGWRPMMFIYGALGLVVAAIIWWSCRATPSEHPSVNDAEAALISGGLPARAAAASRVTGVPLRQLVTSWSMWCSCIMQWFTNIGWLFLVTWAPRYLADVHHVPTEQRALLVSIPPLIGWAGMLSGGAVTDFCARTIGLHWGRALPIALSRFVAMLAYLGCLFEPNVYTAVVLFSIVAFSTDFGTPSSWAFTQDVGGRYVGSVLGWGNMWGNLGAAVTPTLLIWINQTFQGWNYAFLASAIAFLFSGIFALGINASIPIIPEEPLEKTPAAD